MDKILKPNSRQIEWYRRGLTAFIHFGINTFTCTEWGSGEEDPAVFNPTALDCRQWIKTLKDAGFGVAILTVKHHDGFCLWPSKYTEHTIKKSPYKDGKGDIMREFVDACNEFGVKAGVYLSPWDKHEKTWGTPLYNDFYVNQLTELLTNYGEIWEVWWDGAGSVEAKYDWTRWNNTVRTLQPNAIIFGSFSAAPFIDVRWAGNELGYAGKPCWATVDLSSIEKEIVPEINSGKFMGERFIPAEIDVSIRPGWFYKEHQDSLVRSPKNLFEIWLTSIGRNAGLLLNIPPDTRGLFNENDVKSINEFGKYLKDNLKNNLLDGATVTASDYVPNFGPQNLTDKQEETYYKSSKNSAVIEDSFAKDKTFNTVVIEEMIEFGHIVYGYNVSIKQDGEWEVLFKNECLGNRCVEKFDPVTASAIRLEITDAIDLPCIRSFGVYNFGSILGNEFRTTKGKNILENKAVKVERKDNVLTVFFDGIYPFNTIKMDGKGLVSYEVFVYNGAMFEPSDGEIKVNTDIVVHKFEKTKYAYQLHIKLNEDVDGKNLDRKLELYLD